MYSFMYAIVLYKIYLDYFVMIDVSVINILNQHKLQMVSLMISYHHYTLKCYGFLSGISTLQKLFSHNFSCFLGMLYILNECKQFKQ